MLVQCPECSLQVSDRAYSCPHCGNPMNTTSSPKRKKPNKRRRLPNGFGQITEKVYTDRDSSWLASEIEKIKVFVD